MNSGWLTAPKIMNTTSAIGRIGRTTSVSCQLVTNRMISVRDQQQERLRRQHQALAR